MKKKRSSSNIKRGRLSNAEKRTIEDMLEFKSDLEIAQELRRAAFQVTEYKKQYLASSPAPLAKRSEAENIKRELKARPEWSQIREEFSDVELTFFENDFVSLRQQFKEMAHTEFKQVRRLITLDILMHRHMVERKRSQSEIERLERILAKEYSKSNVEQDLAVITQLETNLQANKAASSQKTKEYKDLQDEYNKILKDLKATRDQIYKNLDQKGKFIEILKRLADEDSRRIINEEVGLYHLGTQEEKKKLAKFHTYQDGVIDRPLLTPETVNG